ncbi:hypothetical protein DNTS_012022 [Danionella cerebrum]|uniref:Septin-type G domain-containing protein n=1 Tax=Danionella cerebrum TaxID=2873325 RepID=A0A553MX14_9TELE|nr:hypothetical protein DNTS_012022 [Danionella translucida]TRY57745.1 hypothetical protein DNTS_012022 [Danionella translucida]
MLKTHEELKRPCCDASLLQPGPPALYQLNTKRTFIEESSKIQTWTYGEKDESKQNKVILVVGETGAGKTTIINTMVNFLMGVKFEDQVFYEITEEGKDNQKTEKRQNPTQSQTLNITVYEVFVEESPISLTIIDTPGYGHTEGFEKDREITESVMRLFSAEDGIHYIDAVCFVMKASLNRLVDRELYIFHSVLSLFGKDIENNIVFLLTQSGGGPPTDALHAINEAEIPCRRDDDGDPMHFLFNNQQKEERNKKYQWALKSSWDMGDHSMNAFFSILEETNRKSVQMTLDVLKEQTRLEACISNLCDQISQKESKDKELNQIQKILNQNIEEIRKREDFEFVVERFIKEKVSTENEWWWNKYATCCTVCEENCHEQRCWWANTPSDCWVMSEGNCTVCSRKCHHSKHVRENKKYSMVKRKVTMTFENLKKDYEHSSDVNLVSFDKKIYENTNTEYNKNMEESSSLTKIEKGIKRDLEKINAEKKDLVQEAYHTILRFPQIALKNDSAFILQYVDLLIPKLREEGKDEWVKQLEKLKKAGEKPKNKGALQYVLNMGKLGWARIRGNQPNENQ